MKILVTGAAGFIGYHLCERLLKDGHEVAGIDNLNSYYDPELKQARLARLAELPEAGNFSFAKVDLADAGALAEIFSKGGFSHVVNLAAQAGVRYSLEHPEEYIASNLTGFGNLLEQCRKHKIAHLVFASSSSVYGMNEAQPYSCHQNVDHPVSLYAATKKSNELMAHSYSHLFKLPATGLRFFTVYGPWGRPDMAPYLFTNAIIKGRPLKIFNNGELERDFTYIDDIVEGIARVLPKAPSSNPAFQAGNPDPASSFAPWRIYNIGNGRAIALGDFIAAIEEAVGKKAIREYLPMQPGDVKSTLADVDDLYALTGFRPATSLKDGIAAYVGWHKEYYGND